MKNRHQKGFMQKYFYVVALLILASCQNTKKTESDSSWPSEMQHLAQSFEELIPFVYSEHKFQNPINKQEIQKKIENFRENIHQISPEKAKQLYGADPLMIKGLENLKEISSRSLSYFELGKTIYAQNLLKQSAKYCFQCHTRIPAGPQHMFWNKFSIENYALEPYEKAQIYVAMRQYDKAKSTLAQFVKDSGQQDNLTLLREQDIKYYLLIAIRGQSQFEEANLFISQQVKNQNLSRYFKENLQTWKRDLTFWAKNFASVPHNLQGAKKALGFKKNSFEINEPQFVKAIVAALMIHEGLSQETDASIIAESYYILGCIYEYFTVGGFWDLSDFYYEICVDTLPHSDIAVRCVNRLNESLIIKNSGSRGLVLPEVEVQRLNDLKKRAKPTKK